MTKKILLLVALISTLMLTAYIQTGFISDTTKEAKAEAELHKKLQIAAVDKELQLEEAVNDKVLGRKYKEVISAEIPASLKQGQTAFITVKSSEELVNPRASFNGKVFRLFQKSPNTYFGMYGIEANHKPGSYKISLRDDSGNLKEDGIIKITKGNYPIQNITLTGSKKGIEPTAKELKLVSMAKLSVTSDSYWDEPPFNNPTKGCISSVYGLNRYYNGKASGDYHKGLDIKAPQGRDVYALTGGRVTVGEFFRLHGGTVGIDHGQGLTSLYLHMSKITVKPGEMVKVGQKVGEVGSTGASTGPHLHWGLYINGLPVDPTYQWIKPVSKCG